MAKKEPKWRILAARASPAEYIGVVEAPDADAAIEKAIAEFGILDPERQKRLLAVPME